MRHARPASGRSSSTTTSGRYGCNHQEKKENASLQHAPRLKSNSSRGSDAAVSSPFAVKASGVPDLRAKQIVDAIADAAARWRDADFPPRVRITRALMNRTQYTEPVVDVALDRLFGAIDRTTLRATIAGELGALEALDDFITRLNRPDVRYRAVEGVAIVSSDTTIGVAVPALVFALCAKAHVVVKDRDDRLVAAFAQTLGEERPELGRRIVTGVWRGDDESATRAQLASAETVVAFGRDDTLAAIRAQLAPETRFVPFGHRTSIAIVARESLTDRAGAQASARSIAVDMLLYDGDGCLSLHAAFVESGAPVSPSEFAQLLAQACDEVSIEFPAGYPQPDTATGAYARAAAFRAAQGSGAVFPGKNGPHLLVLDPPHDEPPPFLRRTLALYPVAGPAEVLDFVRRHALSLEAVAFSDAGRTDLTELALAAGATRIASLGTLQDPPLGGEHGGVARILPFVHAIYRQ